MTFALQQNVLRWQNPKHAEREILCLDMFWIHFIFNDRLTLIPHISGLSTQWQVHMVCFSEMHPNPTSQPHAFIRIHFEPPQSGSASWSGAALGLSGINNAAFRCQGPLWSSSEHHTTPPRQNQMLFSHDICPPDAFLFTCVSGCNINLFRLRRCGSCKGENSFNFPRTELQLSCSARAL